MRKIKFRAWIKNSGRGEQMEYYDLQKDQPDKFLLLHCAINLNMPSNYKQMADNIRIK
jgi:hypothetical protein